MGNIHERSQCTWLTKSFSSTCYLIKYTVNWKIKNTKWFVDCTTRKSMDYLLLQPSFNCILFLFYLTRGINLTCSKFCKQTWNGCGNWYIAEIPQFITFLSLQIKFPCSCLKPYFHFWWILPFLSIVMGRCPFTCSSLLYLLLTTNSSVTWIYTCSHSMYINKIMNSFRPEYTMPEKP